MSHGNNHFDINGHIHLVDIEFEIQERLKQEDQRWPSLFREIDWMGEVVHKSPYNSARVPSCYVATMKFEFPIGPPN